MIYCSRQSLLLFIYILYLFLRLTPSLSDVPGHTISNFVTILFRSVFWLKAKRSFSFVGWTRTSGLGLDSMCLYKYYLFYHGGRTRISIFLQYFIWILLFFEEYKHCLREAVKIEIKSWTFSLFEGGWRFFIFYSNTGTFMVYAICGDRHTFVEKI